MGWTDKAKEKALKRQEESPTILCGCGCGQELKALDKWGRPRKYISGHNGRKYRDPLEYKKVWWDKAKKDKDYLKKRYEDKKRRRLELKKELLEHLGNRCSGCGIEHDGNNSCIFDFHHDSPDNKEHNISKALNNISRKVLYEEVDKCSILCSNCHRLYHNS